MCEPWGMLGRGSVIKIRDSFLWGPMLIIETQVWLSGAGFGPVSSESLTVECAWVDLCVGV